MSQTASSAQTCPSCGAPAPTLLKHSKLAVCGFCNSTLFVNDAQVQSAGEKSVLTQIPSILQMGRRFEIGQWLFEPIGRIRYEHRKGAGQSGDGQDQSQDQSDDDHDSTNASGGYWDEWWVLLSDGKTRWISNDEGEYVIETAMELQGEPPAYDTYQLGAQITLFNQSLRVTELNEATCAGVEGQLPEIVKLGDVHHYAHLEGDKGVLVTAEYDDAGAATFHKGLWIDAFDIKAS